MNKSPQNEKGLTPSDEDHGEQNENTEASNLAAMREQAKLQE